MSDLLNDPGSLCSCEQLGCKEAAAWAEGPIIDRIRWRAPFYAQQRQTARNHLSRLLVSAYLEYGLPVPEHLTPTRSTAA